MSEWTHGVPSRSEPSGVYVLSEFVGGRQIEPVVHSQAQVILERHYDILPEPVKRDTDVLLDNQRKRNVGLRRWAGQAVVQYRRDGTIPARRGKQVWTRGQWREMPYLVAVLVTVIEAGRGGVTNDEIRVLLGMRSNGISGALSVLQEAGVIVRLKETR